jgi:hypothetical protein
VLHKASGVQARLDTSVGTALPATTEVARKEIESAVRFRARAALTAQRGLTVPEDRIAVILF